MSLAGQRATVPSPGGIGMRATTCGEFLSYESIAVTSVQDARSPFGQLYIIQATATVRVRNATLYQGHRSLRVIQCRVAPGLSVARPVRATFRFDAEQRNGRWRIVSS
jgi:hypothetical protein